MRPTPPGDRPDLPPAAARPDDLLVAELRYGSSELFDRHADTWQYQYLAGRA